MSRSSIAVLAAHCSTTGYVAPPPQTPDIPAAVARGRDRAALLPVGRTLPGRRRRRRHPEGGAGGGRRRGRVQPDSFELKESGIGAVLATAQDVADDGPPPAGHRQGNRRGQGGGPRSAGGVRRGSEPVDLPRAGGRQGRRPVPGVPGPAQARLPVPVRAARTRRWRAGCAPRPRRARSPSRPTRRRCWRRWRGPSSAAWPRRWSSWPSTWAASGRSRVDDVEDLIAETRERGVFELTKAIGAGDVDARAGAAHQHAPQPRTGAADPVHAGAAAAPDLAGQGALGGRRRTRRDRRRRGDQPLLSRRRPGPRARACRAAPRARLRTALSGGPRAQDLTLEPGVALSTPGRAARPRAPGAVQPGLAPALLEREATATVEATRPSGKPSPP